MDAPTETPSHTESDDSLGLSSYIALATLAAAPVLFATGWTSYALFKRDALLGLSALALTVWALEVLRARGARFGAGRLICALLLFTGWVATSSVWAPAKLAGVLDASLILAGASLTCVLAAPARRAPSWSHLSGALGLGAALAGAAGLLDLAGVGLFTIVWDPPGPTGTFDSAEFVAAYYTIALPPLAAGVAKGSTPSRILSGAGLLLGGAHFALCGEVWGVALVAAIGIIGAAVPALIRRTQTGGVHPIALGGGAAILIAAMLGPATLGPDSSLSNPATGLPVVENNAKTVSKSAIERNAPTFTKFAIMRYESATDPVMRDYAHQRAIDAGKTEPLIGNGAGSFWGDATEHIDMTHPLTDDLFDIYPAFRSPHSAYLKVFAEQGIIGVALWLLTLFAIGALCLKAMMGTPEDELDDTWVTQAWGVSAGLVAGAAAMWSTAFLEAPASAMTWFGLVGWLAHHASVRVEDGWTAGWGEPDGAGIAGFSPALFGISIAAATLTLAGFSITSGYFRGAADQFMLRGRYEQALPYYERAQRALPAHAEDLYNQAVVRMNTGGTRGALPYVTQSLDLRPHDARVIHAKAKIHMANLDFLSAAKAEERALRRFPHYLEAYTSLAAAKSRATDIKSAAEVFERALALDPPISVRGTMAESLGQLYEGPLKSAKDALKWYEYALEYTEARQTREKLGTRVEEMKKRVKRERLMREGKPIPKELMPEKDHDAAGEIMGVPGGHDGHQH